MPHIRLLPGVAQVYEGRRPLCRKVRREISNRTNIVRALLVATLASRSATPFDNGGYETDELIRIPLCSQHSLILPPYELPHIVKHDSLNRTLHLREPYFELGGRI